MKVLHISFVGELSRGLKSQLQYESQAAEAVGCDWESLVYHRGKIESSVERALPLWARGFFLRRLFAWVYLMKHHKNYDVVMQRYMVLDVFALFFSRFVSNRITVHHSKEIEELELIRTGYKGRLASLIESVVGRRALKRNLGLIGVTEEIFHYENKRGGGGFPKLIYANGIYQQQREVLIDKRDKSVVNIAFASSEFKPWQGLEILFEKAKSYTGNSIFVHIMGKLNPNQIEKINQLNNNESCRVNLVSHGYLKKDELIKVLQLCDIGIDCLLIADKGLTEACTFKSREYLFMGLPVYAGHNDRAFPENFPYFLRSEFDFDTVYDFAMSNKDTSRDIVVAEAKPFIDKSVLLKKLTQDIKAELL
ncbi:hypothetical protein [Vibrio sp. C8]